MEQFRFCVVATHPESGQKRVSLSGSIINNAQNVAFLVTGENKAEKVAEIVSNPEASAKKYPAALVKPKSKNLVWFLDKKAAKNIND
jgi:6-phosphogluconolactonase